MSSTKRELSWIKSPWSLIILVWIGTMAFQYYWVQQKGKNVTYSELNQAIEKGEINEIKIQGDEVAAKGIGSDGLEVKMTSRVFDPGEFARTVDKRGIQIAKIPEVSFWSGFLFWLILIYFAFFLWKRFSKTMGKGMNPMLSLGRSKARVHAEKSIKTCFADVAGVNEAKAELQEVVDFLKDKETFTRLGGRSPKGILLVGPPGTGKTLIAKAVAGEASVPFFSINGSEFVELFVGMGAARVRDLFDQAKKAAPCIIFIDELDAMGRARGPSAASGGNDEKEQTLNQLLAELDGFDTREGVILLAATNRPEVLDPALLRAGRFDRQILLDNPDQRGREAILEIHMKKILAKKNLEVGKVAALTPGFSGADLANLVNEAALVATRNGANEVELNDFTKAIERIVGGLERRSRIMSGDEKERVAFHELGHATVSLAMSTTTKVHKISIIPRGIGALGYTFQRPLEDRYLITQSELLVKIAILLGGYVSEFIQFQETSNGATDDLAKATEVAKAMVLEFGMSPRVGLASYSRQKQSFLISSGTIHRDIGMSESMAAIVDEEVTKILRDCQKLAIDTIKKNQRFVQEASKRLISKETLGEDELRNLWESVGQRESSLLTDLKCRNEVPSLECLD